MKKQVKNIITGTASTLAAAVFVAGCAGGGGGSGGGAAPSIASPATGFYQNAAPSQFVINYGSKPANLVIALNGVHVQQYFNFGPTSATASGADLEDFLLQGKNTLKLNPSNLFGPSRSFTFDDEGPKVVVQEVSNTTSVIEVRGELRDPSGANSLTVNGNNATVNSDGTFSVTIDRVATNEDYVFVASDNIGKTSTTLMAPPGREFQESIKARVDQNTIEKIIPILTDLLKDGIQIKGADVLPNGGQLFSLTWDGLFNEPYGVSADLDTVAIGGIAINEFSIIQNEDGKIFLDANIKNLNAGLYAYIYNGLLPFRTDIPVIARVGDINFRAGVELAATNGELNIQLTDVDFHINDFDIDFASIRTEMQQLDGELQNPGDSNGLLNAINDVIAAIANGISEPVGKLLVAIINPILADSLTELAVSANLHINDTGLNFKTSVQELGTENGNIVVGLSGRLKAEPVDNGVPPALASVYTQGALPDLSYAQGGIGAIISGNFLNQATLAAYRAGITNITIITSDITNIGSILNGIHFGTKVYGQNLGNDGDMRIRVMPRSPAGLTFFGKNVTAAQIALHNWDIFIELKSNGNYNPILALGIDVTIPIGLAITADNGIAINQMTTPDIEILKTQVLGSINLPTEVINGVVDFVVPIIFNKLEQTIATIKVPTIAGITLLPEAIQAVGNNNEHLAFYGSLQ